MKPAKLIFLDVDGVLAPRHLQYRIDRYCVHLLNRITRATEADIVVSSTWRMFPDKMGMLMDCGIEAPIIGVTPILNRGVRGDEIQAVLSSTGVAPASILILDDDSDMGPLSHRLIRTNTQVGLQAGDVPRAIALLTGQETHRPTP